MSREKVFKVLFAVLISLLLLLLFRFKPGIEGPKKLERPRIVEGSAVLSGKSFRFEVKEKNELKYVITADEVHEKNKDEKELKNPAVLIPRGEGRGDVVTGEKGFFSVPKSELRIFDGAKITMSDGLEVSSSGFRINPQDEVVSEGRAVIRRETLAGAGDLLRYDREKRIAYLEGNVSFEDEDLFFRAGRIRLDLLNHDGRIEGPVEAKKKDATITAPGGDITLTPENRISKITLAPEVSGETGFVSFSSRFGDFGFGKGSDVSEMALRGSAVLEQKSDPSVRLETGNMTFSKDDGDAWSWRAPGEMFFFRQGMKVTSPGGDGTIEKGLLLGDLSGPVRGWDENSEISSASGKITAEGFELIGNAQAVQGGGTIAADRIVIDKTGGKRAVGNVAGRRTSPEGGTVYFSGGEAKVSPSIYPVRLTGAARVHSEKYDVKSEDITLVSEKSFRACKGVAVAFEGGKNPVFVHGQEAELDEALDLVSVTGKPGATDGEDKLSATEKITAFMGRDGKAEKIIAVGSAVYENASTRAAGDRITYYPLTRKGEVYSEKGRAEVVQLDPYKRAAGKRITFGDKELTIKGEEGAHHRGKIEGVEERKKENGDRPAGNERP